MAGGRRTGPPEPLAAARERCLAGLQAWAGQAPEVRPSAELQDLMDEAESALTGDE
jgi:hypothetical protein